MVDRDKIKERSSVNSGKDGGKSGNAEKSSKGGSSSSGEDINLDGEVGGDTYSDKMAKLKGKSGGSKGSSSNLSGRVERGEVGTVLEAIANILFYTEGKMRSYKDPTSLREVKEINVTTTIYEQFTETIAESNVQAICESYNIEWEEDVLQKVISQQDFNNGHDVAGDLGTNVADVGSGRGFKKDHFHQILLAVGRMFLFVKMLEEDYGSRSTPEEKMVMDAIEDVSAKVIDFMGTFNVREVSKQNGISFEQDVIQRLAGE